MAAISADRVIVELEAKIDRYNARVAEAERRFNAASKKIQDSASQMERSINRNTDAIGKRLKGLAGVFAAAFSVQQVIALADTFTRFTNSLKVAGLEGANLTRVQGQLFDIAQRNGVQMESLGGLYGRAAQNQKELGATSAELVQFTSGVAAALRIEGKSATQAAGALQQLGQLLGSTRIQAEEFNSIVDGARPILVAVANNITAAGGSVSRLKQLVNDGKVSNVQFFDAFLQGSQAIEEQAARSNLTIGNSFTILNNALGMYIGQTDDSLSATERISQAIILLANNLDKVAVALGILGAVLLGRFVAGMVAAAASTGVVSTAIFAMQARAAGAATTMEALALTSATAGRAMLAAFGGPVGLAIAALAVGFYYLSGRVSELSEASAEYIAIESRGNAVRDKAAEAAERVAAATGKARNAALANAAAVREETVQYLAQARAALLAARAKAGAAESAAAASPLASPIAGAPRAFGAIFGVGDLQANARAKADLAAARNSVKIAQDALRQLDAAVRAPPTVRVPAAPGSGKKAKGKGKGRTGADPEDIERRFLDDLERLQSERLQAELQVTADAQARAEILRELAKREYESRLRDIEASEEYSAERKAALREELNSLFGREPDGTIRSDSPLTKGINRAEAEQAARELRDVRMEQLDAEVAALNQQQQLAGTQAERRKIQNQLLDAEIQRLRIELDSLQAWQTHERAIAQARLDAAEAARAGNQEIIRRDTEGPLDQYRREATRTAGQIGEDLERVAVSGLDRLNEGLVDAIMGTKSLGDVFKQVANQIIADLLRIAIQKAIMEGLSAALGAPGGGGILSKSSSSAGTGALKGFASGGSFIVGGRGGTDNNVLSINGVPKARVSAGERVSVSPQGKAIRGVGGAVTMSRPQITVISAPQFDLRGMIGTERLFREVDRVSKANAAEAAVAMGKSAMKTVPGRMSNYSKLGT